MLRNTKDLEGYAIRATDGIVGRVKDLYFDDKAWVIRYLVVDTGAWLAHRKVLISPIAIGHPNWPEKVLPVSITKEQVKNSLDIDTDKPVSRQQEMHYLGYYGYPFYWFGPGPWGDEAFPSMLIAGYADPEATRRAVRAWRLEVLCLNPDEYSPVLTAVLMPEGHDADAFRAVVLEHFDMSLGTGLGKVKGKVFRIGHLGDFNALMLAGTIAGVEMGLGLAGVPHQKGGINAAMDYLADPDAADAADAPARASA